MKSKSSLIFLFGIVTGVAATLLILPEFGSGTPVPVSAPTSAGPAVANAPEKTVLPATEPAPMAGPEAADTVTPPAIVYFPATPTAPDPAAMKKSVKQATLTARMELLANPDMDLAARREALKQLRDEAKNQLQELGVDPNAAAEAPADARPAATKEQRAVRLAKAAEVLEAAKSGDATGPLKNNPAALDRLQEKLEKREAKLANKPAQ